MSHLPYHSAPTHQGQNQEQRAYHATELYLPTPQPAPVTDSVTTDDFKVSIQTANPLRTCLKNTMLFDKPKAVASVPEDSEWLEES